MYIKLNEYVENTVFVKHIIAEFIKKIERYIEIETIPTTSNGKELKFILRPKEDQPINDRKKNMDYLEKVVKQNLDIFPKNNYIAGYSILPWFSHKYDRNSFEFRFVVKQQYTQRYFPNQGYLYHSTSYRENLVDIKNNGLELRSSDMSNDWKNDEELKYPPAVFASIPPTTWWDRIDDKVIRIKTKGLPNKWWYDLNLYHAPHKGKYVVTYEPIPPKYLQVFRNERWVNITDLY